MRALRRRLGHIFGMWEASVRICCELAPHGRSSSVEAQTPSRRVHPLVTPVSDFLGGDASHETPGDALRRRALSHGFDDRDDVEVASLWAHTGDFAEVTSGDALQALLDKWAVGGCPLRVEAQGVPRVPHVSVLCALLGAANLAAALGYAWLVLWPLAPALWAARRAGRTD